MIVQACKYVATINHVMYSECCLFKFAISLYVFPVLLLPFTAPEIFTFYLMLLFSKLSGAAEVAQYTLQLRFHILYTYTQSLFFFSYSVVCANTAVLYTQVCEHSSSFHAAKCSSVTLIVLTFIVTSDA